MAKVPHMENQFEKIDIKKYLSFDDLCAIERFIDTNEHEYITSGDAGDTHQLNIARFSRDVVSPTPTSVFYDEIMKIVNQDTMQKLYQDLTGFDKVCIRRLQGNIMIEGDYLGIHIDGVRENDAKNEYKGSHIDYKFAFVIHFPSNYTGGELLIYPDCDNNKESTVIMHGYDAYIITGDLPHSISHLKSGKRKTLVCFLSDNFSTSRSKTNAQKIARRKL
jgi:predicted 2-oxoglutarate/Fe(II)-dependent dioxygenase YbiX